MFTNDSRYYQLGEAIYQEQDGHHIVYKQRRFLPQGSSQPLLTTVNAGMDERLDIVAARVLGVPEQFWRLCDANDAMNPFDLIADTHGLLRVSPPQFQDTPK